MMHKGFFMQHSFVLEIRGIASPEDKGLLHTCIECAMRCVDDKAVAIPTVISAANYGLPIRQDQSFNIR
jgi:hypothetical protein